MKLTQPHWNLDPLDVRILTLLQQDASLSNQELAKRVHLSPAPCLRRVRRLIDSGIIEATVVLVDRRQVGLQLLAYAFVSLESHRTTSSEQFEETMRRRPEVLECVRLSGDHDYLARVVAASMEDYSRFLDQHVLRFAAVRSVSSSFELRVLKRTTALPMPDLTR